MRPRPGLRAACLAVGLAACLAAPAAAHERSLSHSTWQIDGAEARAELTISDRDLSRLRAYALPAPERDRVIARSLADALRLHAGGAACEPVVEPVRHALSAGRSRFVWEVQCAAAAPLTLETRVLALEAPGHLHFARVQRGGVQHERILSEGRRRWRLPASGAEAPPARGPGFAESVAVGVRHIASGADHLAFLLALLLIAASLRQVAAIATGFTIAHSITLALAVLGVVRPDPAPVEALIGLSIALVAAENAWVAGGRGAGLPAAIALVLAALAGVAALGTGALPPGVLAGLALFAACYFALAARVRRPVPLRSAVACLFGLVHGFGFAGVLAQVELPPERLAPALAGFNVGVELGQLAVIALAYPLLAALRTAPLARSGRLASEALTALLFGVGLFWFVTRAYG